MHNTPIVRFGWFRLPDYRHRKKLGFIRLCEWQRPATPAPHQTTHARADRRRKIGKLVDRKSSSIRFRVQCARAARLLRQAADRTVQYPDDEWAANFIPGADRRLPADRLPPIDERTGGFRRAEHVGQSYCGRHRTIVFQSRLVIYDCV
jgi:hypothetical protein